MKADMKTKYLAVLVILLLASSVALAQSYQIQVRFTVRLRASHSLDSPVVGTVLAGDVLQVVGQYNRWLKVARDGTTAWLADWVEYTRQDQQQASPAAEPAPNQQQRANIDNCCFVNRQCHSDREWHDGYWAYQRNECPAQPQSQPSSAAVGGHVIGIEGSHLFINFISEALSYLQARSQQWYNYVISGADRIVEDERQYTAAAASHIRTILVAPYGRLITVFNHEVNIVEMISKLVHEACHIHRYEAGFVYGAYTKVKEEVYCIEQEKVMLRETVAPHLQGNHGIVGIQHCEGSLENHPRCRGFDICEWSVDRKIISCPAIGLTGPPND
ncbi:MAG: SH3 domain-containing protein [Chloroflexota bacterium]|nr:SH3 domain-containing protein [Chloroflexota bacterium]MDE2908642.1 SH3 domain-containing protein [Chloroflexota bacterium]